MSQQIPQHFIQNLLSRIDIIDLIQARVPIKKKGANYSGLCPFHQEKSPSFTVSASKQFYHCFGCGKHDNAIGFLMDYEHLTFPESIEELARIAGMEIPREALSGRESNHTELYHWMKIAAEYYKRMLREHPDKNRAIAYLKKRGVNGHTAKQFQLGFSPNEWDGLLHHVSPKKNEIPILVEAGLINQNDKAHLYDRFRDRILFPIRDKRGRVIGFGGRILDQGEPKYLNSPETPIFQKGKNLYGLFEAKKNMPHLPRILVVEGYMDVVMLAQAGIPYSVATLGTATTAEHLRLLKQETQEVVFCFDGDKAGREAAVRALKVCLPFMTGALDLRFLFIPEGEDPDSLVQKEGKAAFEQRLNQDALSLFDFMLRVLNMDLNLSTLSGKSRWILRAKPYFNSLPDGPFKIFALDSVAKRFGFTPEQVEQQFSAPLPTLQGSHTEAKALNLEEKALALLIQNPLLSQNVASHQIAHAKQLQEMLSLFQTQGFQTMSHVIEFFREKPEEALVLDLAFHPYSHLIEHTDQEWQDLLSKIEMGQEAQHLSRLLDVSRTRALTPEEKTSLRHLLNASK